MTRTHTGPISTAHRRACDALDLAHDRLDDDRVLDRLQSATLHLWYAVYSSDDTAARLDAAEDQLTAAEAVADEVVAATLRTALDQLRGQRSGGEADAE